MTHPALGHHRALDGLRAIAVLAVLGFHANVSWLGGGFLGVDVFFVLSGFLITRLLLDERAWTGAIALGRFYARRALRLLPALALVIVAVLVYAQLQLEASQVSRAWRDALATATYNMNWRQALTDRPPYGRFDHAWSLAIEEQFYVLWPLAVIVLARRWGARGVALGAALAAAASWGDRLLLVALGQPERRIYYALDSHADGLLIGATLAALTVVAAQEGRHLRLPRWAGPLGGAMVLAAFVRFVRGSTFVDVIGAVLLAGAVAVVVLDIVQRGPSSRLLAWTPLVALGRISYGLYLWHWPVYLAITQGDIGSKPLLLAVRVAVSLVLAGASWALVEQPALRLKRRFEPPTAAGAGAPGLAAPTT